MIQGCPCKSAIFHWYLSTHRAKRFQFYLITFNSKCVSMEVRQLLQIHYCVTLVNICVLIVDLWLSLVPFEPLPSVMCSNSKFIVFTCNWQYHSDTLYAFALSVNQAVGVQFNHNMTPPEKYVRILYSTLQMGNSLMKVRLSTDVVKWNYVTVLYYTTIHHK